MTIASWTTMIQNAELSGITSTDWNNSASQTPLTRPNHPANGTITPLSPT